MPLDDYQREELAEAAARLGEDPSDGALRQRSEILRELGTYDAQLPELQPTESSVLTGNPSR